MNAIGKFYNREKREPVLINVFGFQMELDSYEYVENVLLLSPQFYEPAEISFVRKMLKSNSCFIDIGANVGIYSLVASEQVGKEGKILAIEADPYTYKKLTTNIQLNSFENIEPINLGISDKNEILKLKINTAGNRGSSGFIAGESNGPEVNCVPLVEIINKYEIKYIDGMKLDIEGMEYRVLKRFFNDIEKKCYPRFIIVEYNKDYEKWTTGNPVTLLESYGYKRYKQSGQNYIMVLKESS